MAAVDRRDRAAQAMQSESMGGLTGGHRPQRVSVGAARLRGGVALRRSRPAADRRARAAARHRSEVRAAHRVPHPARRARGRAPARRRDRRGQGEDLLVPALLQPRRGRALRSSASTSGATATRAVRRRGAARHRRRSSARTSSAARYHVLQGTISPIEGIGPEQLRIRELLARVADDERRRGDPRDEPQHRRRGHRDVPRPRCSPTRRCASPASRAACPSAATSSTPTRSRSAAPSKAAAPSTPDPSNRVTHGTAAGALRSGRRLGRAPCDSRRGPCG